MNTELCHLRINHVKYKTRCCFPDKLTKILMSFMFQFMVHLRLFFLTGEQGVETEESLSLTLANAMVQKGTTERLAHWHRHRQRHCRQTKAQRHTHTHSYTQIKAQMKILLKSLLLRQEFLKDAAACDKRFKLKPKYLEQAFTTQTNCS